jgi:putative membrane protein
MQNRSVWKGMVAGAIGGLAATFAMTQFQNTWSKLSQKKNSDSEKDQHPRTEDPSTVIFANKILSGIGYRVPDDKKDLVGNIVHYSFGTLAGAAYGAVSEFQPHTRAGFGSAFGTFLFITADEIGVPAAGLSKGFSETPIRVHLYSWASHLIYGTALEASRRATRAAIDKRSDRSSLNISSRQPERLAA